MRQTRIAAVAALIAVSTLPTVSGCGGWRGLNSLPLPGTVGDGPGAFNVKVELPDVTTLQQNSRVRVGDVTVGNVMTIERQGWHALLTLRLNGNVDLPENATAKLGQTSLLGSVHVELAAPTDRPPTGRLHNGSLVPLSSAGVYPTTEQTLAAASLLLNGGGIGQLHDVIQTLSTAFRGHEQELRHLIEQLDEFIGHLNDQSGHIITATDNLNGLVAQFAAQKPKLDRALQTLPSALEVLRNEREHLVQAVDQLGKFGALTADTINKTKDNLVAELQQIAPVLKSLANAGPAMTRALSQLLTYPWPNETLDNWVRGDYANLTAIVDLTLSRIDAGVFTGTRWEGNLTELEMQWGRTIGQFPSPYTAGNPLTIPYRWDQGP